MTRDCEKSRKPLFAVGGMHRRSHEIARIITNHVQSMATWPFYDTKSSSVIDVPFAELIDGLFVFGSLAEQYVNKSVNLADGVGDIDFLVVAHPALAAEFACWDAREAYNRLRSNLRQLSNTLAIPWSSEWEATPVDALVLPRSFFTDHCVRGTYKRAQMDPKFFINAFRYLLRYNPEKAILEPSSLEDLEEKYRVNLADLK